MENGEDVDVLATDAPSGKKWRGKDATATVEMPIVLWYGFLAMKFLA